MQFIMMDSSHWTDVKRIYQQGIDTGQATFESAPPASWEEWSKKFLPDLSLVCLEGDQVLGWAAISQVSSRRVYRGVGEVSLYVAAEHRGQGIGRMLMESIISESEGKGFWALQASIFPENQVSLQLHQDCGFRIVGRREKIAQMSYGSREGEWRDTLFLERRSGTVGK